MGRFFIDRPIVAMVISIIIVIVGVVCLRGLPIAQYPEITPPQIKVTATYQGADALTIEQAVATPIEQQVNGVDYMLYMQSINANDGTMTLNVFFEVGTDLNTSNVLVQNRVSQAAPTLPAEVNQQGVSVKKQLTVPLIIISLFSPKGTYDGLFLTNYSTINMRDELLRVTGVGDVTNFGGSDYGMRVWIRPDRLAKLGITVNDLKTAIQQQNVAAPAGQVGGAPSPPGQQFTYAVRTKGRLTSPEEFGEIIVRSNPDGSQVRMRDVSRVELGAKDYNSIGRLNGAPSAVVAVYQMPGSNALAVAEGVRKKAAEMKTRFPRDLDYVISIDTTLAVTAGIDEIVHTLLEAIVLVILVVFIFLQSWRATLIPLLTVPVALVGTFALFPMLGFSVNTLTLFGLVLAIGIVVDDAIVVVEAVEHHIEHGLSPRDATIKAMNEVSGPVIAIALILSAVFIPVAFMGGITGRLYQQFALTIAVSVMLSALNALTLSPALSAMLLRPRNKEAKGLLARFFGGFNRAFTWTTNRYLGIAGFMVRKAVISLALLGGVVVLAWAISKRLPSGFLPDEDQGYFFVNVQLPDAASLQRTDAVCRKVEEVLKSTDGVEYYNTIAGYSLLSGAYAPYTGFYFVSFKPWEERKTHELQFTSIMQRLNARFAAIPDARVFAFLPPQIPGLGTAGGFSMMLQDRAGGSVDFLAQQLARFLDAARKRPELAGVNSAFRAAVPQVYADIDRDKCKKIGVPIADVNTALQAFLGGAYVNDFNRFGRTFKVYIQSEPEFRVTPEDVGQFYVRSVTNEMVPLSTLVKIEPTAGPEFTNRFNLFRAAEVTGSPAPGYSSGQALTALEEVAHEVLPPEMGYDWSGVAYQEKKAAGNTAAVFAMAIVFVFLILAAQYESWSLPFSVLLGTPLAVLGAFLGLFLRKFDLNVYGQIGLIMLIGLAAKNAILIVEFARGEYHAGKPLFEATMNAAKLRFRPILMTAFAFIFGVIPLTIASGAGANSRQVMGTAVAVGMLVATLLGVFIIPVTFYVVEWLVSRGKVQEPFGMEELNETSGATPAAPAGGAH